MALEDMQHILAYPATVTPWLPMQVIRAMRLVVAVFGVTLVNTLSVVFHTLWAARLSGLLILAFAIGMTLGSGVKSVLKASVLAACACGCARQCDERSTEHWCSWIISRTGVVMSATLLYRIAVFVFVVTAAGHTYAILSPPPPSPGARAVYDSMNNVHFQAGGRNSSYGRVYRGLGLMGTASMLFWAFLSWHLGQLAHSTPEAIGALGWALFAVQLAGVVLSLLYFHLPAMVLSGLAAVIVGLATWLAGR